MHELSADLMCTHRAYDDLDAPLDVDVHVHRHVHCQVSNACVVGWPISDDLAVASSEVLLWTPSASCKKCRVSREGTAPSVGWVVALGTK